MLGRKYKTNKDKGAVFFISHILYEIRSRKKECSAEEVSVKHLNNRNITRVATEDCRLLLCFCIQ